MNAPKKSPRKFLGRLAFLLLALTIIPLASSDASAQYRRGGFGRGGFVGPRVYNGGYYNRGYGGFYGPRVYNRGYGGYYGGYGYPYGGVGYGGLGYGGLGYPYGYGLGGTYIATPGFSLGFGYPY